MIHGAPTQGGPPRPGEGGRRAFTTKDFRLTFTGPEFMWQGESLPGLPLLQLPGGELFEAATEVFAHLALTAGAREGSLRARAYALREWLAFLLNRGVRWDYANDLLLGQWRESHRKARRRRAGKAPAGRSRPVAKPRRVGVKLGYVFSFYLSVPAARVLDNQLMPWKPFVGPVGSGCAITSRMVASKAGPRATWSGARAERRSMVRRSTPNQENVARVLESLRSKGLGRATLRPTPAAGREELLDAERNWAMGRVMTAAGLRAEEVADLSLPQLWDALDAEGLTLGWPLPAAAGSTALEAPATDAQRTALVAAVLDLKTAHYKNLFVVVRGKGHDAPKEREVPFPLDLVADLLEVVVWGVREARVREWRRRDPRYSPPPQLFLSGMTKGALNPGSIADIVKGAFNDQNVDGSAHRLRAFFAQRMALSLLQERVAKNGFRLDQSVRDWVIARVAVALGHEDTATTVKHYLDLAELEYLGAAQQAKLGGLATTWGKFLDYAPLLTEGRLRLLEDVMEALTRPDDYPLVEDIIRMALKDGGSRPRAG